MIEKEIKIMLTQSEYESIKTMFDFEKELWQRNNYYFSRICSERRISVRVREVEEKCLLQVKLPVDENGSLSIKEEIECTVDNVPEKISSDVLSEICRSNIDDAKFIGSMETVRKLCCSYDGIEICLDKNDYLGVTDYEIEIEYTGEYPENIVRMLLEKGISAENKAVGKYTRFIIRLDEKNDKNTDVEY